MSTPDSVDFIIVLRPPRQVVGTLSGALARLLKHLWRVWGWKCLRCEPVTKDRKENP